MKPAGCLLLVLAVGLAQAKDGEAKCSTSHGQRGEPGTGRGEGEGQLVEGTQTWSSACDEDEWKLGDRAQPLYRYQRCDSPSGAVFI